jgi:hypothetical protein
MIALLDDVHEVEGASFTRSMSVRRAGLAERWRASGLSEAGTPERRLRAGSIAVLCSWALMMVAGASVAKLSEHFAQAMPVTDRSLAQASITVVTLGGALGVLTVAVGASMCVPEFVRYLRGGGWHEISRVTTWASGSTLVTAFALVGLVVWAQGLSSWQRNGGDAAYSLVFLLVALMGAVSLGTWTVVAVRSVIRIDLGGSILRAEGALALGVTAAMALVTAGSITWFVQIALHAPLFFQGTSGTLASLTSPRIVATVAVMALALGSGLFGSTRIVRSWRDISLPQ